MVATLSSGPAALHPAARRRLMSKMPEVHDHEIRLQPIGGGSASSIIVSADEQDFLQAVLADLGNDGWRTRLQNRRPSQRGSDGVLELSQPIHRRFHIALFEAICPRPGKPRVDPRKLVQMGLVLRRREGGRWSGWMSEGPSKRGWLPLQISDADPAAARQATGPKDSKEAIDRLIAMRRGQSALSEEILPLFVAPAKVCKARNRTILYGLIPVTSAERSETAAPSPDYNALEPADAVGIVNHLTSFLKESAKVSLPFADTVLSPAMAPLQISPDETGDLGKMRKLGAFLQQLVVELDALGTGAGAQALMSQLDAIRLPTARDTFGRVSASVSAAGFVRGAIPILIEGKENNTGMRMPLEWPAISAGTGARLTRTALSCLSERHAAVAPQIGKFDGASSQYAVRAFVRAEGPTGCVPKLHWSEPSESFRILPWWDGSGPATKISLPNVTDFKRVKPNVSFEVPPFLGNLLGGDMKKLSDGSGTKGPNLDIFWLCSFSIPIITICAFIVLNIFLMLFNIVFSWLAFIKICIPIPRPK